MYLKFKWRTTVHRVRGRDRDQNSGRSFEFHRLQPARHIWSDSLRMRFDQADGFPVGCPVHAPDFVGGNGLVQRGLRRSAGDRRVKPTVTVFADYTGMQILKSQGMSLADVEKMVREAKPREIKSYLPLLKFAKFGDGLPGKSLR